jgi:hypothetical protein
MKLEGVRQDTGCLHYRCGIVRRLAHAHKDNIIDWIDVVRSTNGIRHGDLYQNFVGSERPEFPHLAGETKGTALFTSYL